MSARLLIVYNADGGLLNGALDMLHKIVSPATYPCRLCEVTYGAVGMRGQWRQFLDGLGLPVAFHHRDDFAAAYPRAGVALPAILLERGDELETLISADDFARLRTLDELTALLKVRLPLPA